MDVTVGSSKPVLGRRAIGPLAIAAGAILLGFAHLGVAGLLVVLGLFVISMPALGKLLYAIGQRRVRHKYVGEMVTFAAAATSEGNIGILKVHQDRIDFELVQPPVVAASFATNDIASAHLLGTRWPIESTRVTITLLDGATRAFAVTAPVRKVSSALGVVE